MIRSKAANEELNIIDLDATRPDKVETAAKRTRRNMKFNFKLQIGIVGVVLVLLGLLVLWYADGLTGFRTKTPTHQFCGGMIFDYDEDSVLRMQKSGVTLKDSKGEYSLFDTPLIYNNERKLLLPKNMLLMVPSEGTKLYRINYFTTVTEQSKRVTFSKDKKQAQSYGGFLYDGDDIYIFLEETTLTVGNVTVTLGPLSYANVNYRQSVEYYNSTDGSIQLIGTNDVEVTATANSGYKLDLARDVIFTSMGESLLFSSVDSINSIEME